MKKIYHLLSHDTYFFFICSTVFVFLGFLPMILQTLHAPADKVFPLIHNSPHDFYFYMALMNQGSHGAWLVTDPYTTEVTRPSFIGSFFVVLGKIGGLVNLPHPLMYNLVRLIFAFSLLASVYFLYATIFNKIDRKIAFIFYLIAGSFLKINHTPGGWKFSTFMDWWTGIDVTRRHVFLPHHLLANTLLVLSMILLIEYVKKKQLHVVAWIGLLLTITAFIHTPSTLVFMVCIPVALLLSHLRRYLTNPILPVIFLIFALLLPIYIVQSQVKLGFPWSQLTAWEATLNYPVAQEIVGALGVLFPFALLALIPILKKRTFDMILLLCWFLVPLSLLPFATSLSLNPIRLTQGALFVPLAGLALIGVNLLSTLSNLSHLRVKTLLTGLIILISLPTLIFSVYSHTMEFWGGASNVYLSVADVRTFTALGRFAPKGSKVLGSFYTSNTAPGYAPVTLFIGSYTYTKNLNYKEGLTIRFLKGQMSNQEAKEFLKANHLDFVIAVNHDNWLYGWPGNRYPSFLKPLYEEGANGVYKVTLL